MSSNTSPPNPHTTAFVQENLPQIVEQLASDGENAHPLVFGTGEPQAALISAAQYKKLAEHFDDLLDEPRLRARMDSAPNDNDLEVTSLDEVAQLLGIDESDR